MQNIYRKSPPAVIEQAKNHDKDSMSTCICICAILNSCN